jgi:hypothetical protein
MGCEYCERTADMRRCRKFRSCPTASSQFTVRMNWLHSSSPHIPQGTL